MAVMGVMLVLGGCSQAGDAGEADTAAYVEEAEWKETGCSGGG